MYVFFTDILGVPVPAARAGWSARGHGWHTGEDAAPQAAVSAARQRAHSTPHIPNAVVAADFYAERRT